MAIYIITGVRAVYRSLPEALPGNVPNFQSPFQTQAPLKVYFDFTYLCNLECRHCITFSSPRFNRKNELSSNWIIAIKMVSDLAGCAELADGGTLRLRKIKSCGAGMETAYISTEGKVQPCYGTPEVAFG